MATEFEEMMVPRLEATADDEASRLVLDAWDHRRLEDAMLDAIEALHARKTRRLRAWIDQFEDYKRWLALKARGWKIEKGWDGPFPRKHDRLVLLVPREEDRNLYIDLGESAGLAPIVAAGVGALEIQPDWRPQTSGEPLYGSSRFIRQVYYVRRGSF